MDTVTLILQTYRRAAKCDLQITFELGLFSEDDEQRLMILSIWRLINPQERGIHQSQETRFSHCVHRKPRTSILPLLPPLTPSLWRSATMRPLAEIIRYLAVSDSMTGIVGRRAPKII